MLYRWLDNGEIMLSSDEYTPVGRPTNPNDEAFRWATIPVENVGKAYYSHEYRGTRRIVK
jgi:hypothetical protein